MTQLAEPTVRRPAVQPSRRQPGDERAGRWVLIAVLIVAMVSSGLTSGWASDWKDHHSSARPVQAERGALSGMNSYALALMLGGLRGPLVMVLWSKVENQKIDRDLEDVDTMIEWIRLLQPEFVTVHIFQIWNKAYNISALMASTGSKYTTILDAVDYARRVDADRPGDMNILDQLARVFGEKLGGPNVSERAFYRRQFRQDSMTDANRAKAYPDEKNYHRLGVKFFNGRNGPLLDATNNILAELLAHRVERPANLPADKEWNTGAELQYLDRYQPYPLGIPPIAMGYNYAKRAQVAMTVGGQKPVQLSPMVIDSYPGLLLKQWTEREEESAIGFEARAFGVPDEQAAPEPVAAAVAPLTPVVNRQALDDAIYSDGLAERLAGDSIHEYERHLANPQYVNSAMNYSSHLQDLACMRLMTGADHLYLQSFLAGADRARLFAEAQAKYRSALTRYERLVLTYYVETALQPSVFHNQKLDLDKLNESALDHLYASLLTAAANDPKNSQEHAEERSEYGAFINRCALRLQQIAAYGQKSILETH